jgi:hypothetical protein
MSRRIEAHSSQAYIIIRFPLIWRALELEKYSDALRETKKEEEEKTQQQQQMKEKGRRAKQEEQVQMYNEEER